MAGFPATSTESLFSGVLAVNGLKKVYFVLNKISDVICLLFEILAVLLVVVNAADVFLQVFNRYVLAKISNISMSWTQELARYSMIWICYSVIGICFREGSMAQVDIIYGKLGRKGRMVLYVITRILMAAFLFVAIKYGLYVCKIKKIYKSSMLRAPGRLLYSAPIVGSVFLGFEILTEMIGVFCGELEPFEAGKKRRFLRHEEPEQTELSLNEERG